MCEGVTPSGAESAFSFRPPRKIRLDGGKAYTA
jgi:hypothetical protein